jgi:hypothetical protein
MTKILIAKLKNLVIMNTWDRKTLQFLGQVAKDNQLQKNSI